MSKKLELAFGLRLEGGKIVADGFKNVEGSITDLGDAAEQTGGNVHDCMFKLRQGESFLRKFSRTISLAGAGLGLLGGAAAAIGSVTDEIKSMNARLLMASGSQQAFNQAQSQAKRIAEEARSDYQATVNLLSRITVAADQFNVSQSKVVATTEAVTYGLKLYGASAAEVSSVQTQLSQALASGTLAGDEFKSMAEASPRLMQALADGLGIARGELKQLAADGKLTTKTVVDALAEQSAVLKQEFEVMPVTIGEAMGQVKNVLVQGIGDFDAATGATEKIATAVQWFGQNLGVLTKGLVVAAAGMTAFYTVQKIGTITTAVTQIIALERALGATSTTSAIASVAMKRFSSGAAVATGGVRALGVALMANPIGLIATAVAGAITAFILFKDKIKPVSGSIASLGNYASVAFDYIGKGIKWLFSPIKLLTKAWDVVGSAIADLVEPAKSTWETIGGVLSQFLGFVKGVANKFIGLFVGSYKAIIAMWDNFPQALNAVIVSAVNWALDGINSFVRGTAGLLNKIPGVEIDVSTLGFTKLENKAKSSAQTVAAAFSTGFNADYIGAAAGAISEGFTAAVDDVKSKIHEIGEAWTDLAEAEAYQRLNDPLNDMNDSTAEIAKTLGQLPPKTDNVGESSGKAGNKIKGMGKAAKAAADELAKMKKAANDAAAGLFAQLFPGQQLLLDMQKDAATLADAISGKASDAMKQYGLSVTDVAKKQAELNTLIQQLKAGSISEAEAKKAFDAMKQGIAGVKEEAEETSSVLETQFKRAVESIDQSFADMWKSILSGGKVSFKSLGDSLKNIFAETLHGLTTQKLTGWVTGLFSDTATMDSVTGDVKKDQTALGIWDTLKGGFDKLDTTFAKGLNKLFDLDADQAKFFGKLLGGATLGAGVGGTVAGMMGSDTSVGSILGALGGAAGKWAGGAVSSMLGGTLGSIAGFALPVVGSILGSVLGGIFGKKRRPEAEAIMTADGRLLSNKATGIDGSVPLGMAEDWWVSAKDKASDFGVDLSAGLMARVAYMQAKEGLKVYYNLFADGDRGNVVYGEELLGDDAKDPAKIATLAAQMQLAALKTADWSEVSGVIGEGLKLALPENYSQENLTAIYQWMDDIVAAEKVYSGNMTQIAGVMSGFSGSFDDYMVSVSNLLSLSKNHGRDAVDAVDDYVASLKADVTQGEQLKGQQLADIESAYETALAAADKRIRSTSKGSFAHQRAVAARTQVQRRYEEQIQAIGEGFKALASVPIADVIANFAVLSDGLQLVGQKAGVSGVALVSASQQIVKSLGGQAKAQAIYTTIFNATASATRKAGLTYQAARQNIDALNTAMGLSGERAILTTDALRDYVAGLDPLATGYADAMTQAASLADGLVNLSAAAKYFNDAIAKIGATLDGTITTIREDLLDDQSLYDQRKAQAESLIRTISSMNAVGDINSTVEQINSLVNNMWRSLGEEARNADNGNWMIDFLEEAKTLAQGRIEEIQNQYGATNPAREGYDDLKANAESVTIDTAALAAAANQQAQAGDKQLQAGSAMDKAANTMGSAVERLTAAAGQIAGSAAVFAQGYAVDVTVHSTSEASEMT